MRPWRNCFWTCGLFAFALLRQSAASPLLEREQEALQTAQNRIAPSVVRIDTLAGVRAEAGRDEFDVLPSISSSAVVIRSDGLALASRACVPDDTEGIVATLPSGEKTSAQRVAVDHLHGLVLLKISSNTVWPEVESVPIAEQKVGMWSIAVGRGGQQEGPYISVGVVSAKGRLWGRAVQTDAKISPSNYGGALVDIRGRLIGVLIEAPAEAAAEGGELYDSGIGFAIPLSGITSLLSRLEKGESIHPGLMGITMKGSDPFTSPPILSGARPGGPARPAGLRAGDKIVATNGTAVERQAELKQFLGAHPAGDSVRFTVERDGERREVELTLVEKIPPYERPMLGIFPRRDDSGQDGVTVRAVVPHSPADEAGLKAEDRIFKTDDTKILSAAMLRQQLADAVPGEEVSIHFLRGDAEQHLAIKLGPWLDEPAHTLPSAGDKYEKDKTPTTKTGRLPLSVPELDNEATVLVPDNFDSHIPHGILVWISTDKNGVPSALKQFQAICARDHLLLLIPQPAEGSKWKPADAVFVQRAIDQLIKRCHADAARIAVVGRGSTPFYAAFGPRSKFTGLGIIDSEIPRTLHIPETEPNRQLSVMTFISDKWKANPRVSGVPKRLIEFKYPVTTVPVEIRSDTPVLEAETVAAWLDGLDRM